MSMTAIGRAGDNRPERERHSILDLRLPRRRPITSEM